MNTPPSSIALVLFGSFVGSFGAVFLKAGAQRLHLSFPALLANWRLAAGVVAFLLSSVFFVLGLRHGELSVLYPLVSLGYIWAFVWSRIFFGEPATRAKLAGLGLIVIGSILVGLGSR